MRRSLLLLATSIGLGFANDAGAQTAPDTAQPSGPEPSTGAPSKSDTIEEVVVTAERREARSQNVPIAITALSANQLQTRGVADAFDLGMVTPSFISNREVGFGTPFMRGIGSSNVTAGDEPSVATYIDGFYQGLSVAAGLPFNDLQRVEVLKGPQGTLYGRNAVGGLVSYVTRAPEDSLTFGGSVGYGNYDTFKTNGFITGPILDWLDASLAFTAQNQGTGFGQNLVTGKSLDTDNYFALRGKFLANFSDDASLLIGIGYADMRDNRANVNSPEPGTLPLLHGPGILYATNPFDFAGNIDPLFKVKQMEANSTFKLDLEFAKFVSLTQWRRVDSANQVEGDGTTGDGILETQQINPFLGVKVPVIPGSFYYNSFQRVPYFITQEFQLVSESGGPLSWIIGSYLQSDKDSYNPLYLNYTTAPGGTLEAIARFQKTLALASYAQATYALDNGLSGTAGLRYSTEQRSIGGPIYLGTPSTNAGILSGDQAAWFHSLTYHFALDYRINPELMVYVTTNKGFKSGVFDTTAIGTPPVRPEDLIAYETGFKADPTPYLRVNGSFYYYKYRSLQTFINLPSGLSNLQNVGGARMYGAELEVEATPLKGLNIHGGAGLEHARYASFDNAALFLPSPSGGNYSTSANASGYHVVRTPQVTANLGVTYDYSLGDRGDLSFNTSVSYTGNYYWDFTNQFRNPAYALLDLSVEYLFPDSHWTVTLWGKNVTNQKYFVYLNNQQRYTSVAYGDPATYGATVRFDY